MITINTASIGNNGLSLNIDVETTVGYNITKARLWTEETYRDEVQAKNLNFKLEQINNKEVFVVQAQELSLQSFSGIYFLEFITNAPDEANCDSCSNVARVIVSNLDQYYKCMSELILKSDLCNSNLFSKEVCDSNPVNKAMTISLLMDSVVFCLELGQTIEAIDLLKKLKKLCSNCSSCKTVTKSSMCNTCNSYKY